MFVIHWVLNGSEKLQSPKHLPALYTNVRHWEQLIEVIKQDRGLREPFIPTSILKCALEQDELDKEYTGL